MFSEVFTVIAYSLVSEEMGVNYSLRRALGDIWYSEGRCEYLETFRVLLLKLRHVLFEPRCRTIAWLLCSIRVDVFVCC